MFFFSSFVKRRSAVGASHKAFFSFWCVCVCVLHPVEPGLLLFYAPRALSSRDAGPFVTRAHSEVQWLDGKTQSGSLNWKHLDRDRWRGEGEDEGNAGIR